MVSTAGHPYLERFPQDPLHASDTVAITPFRSVQTPPLCYWV